MRPEAQENKGPLASTTEKKGAEKRFLAWAHSLHGQVLETTREREGLTRLDVFRATGISVPSLHELETDRRPLSPGEGMKLAALFVATQHGRRYAAGLPNAMIPRHRPPAGRVSGTRKVVFEAAGLDSEPDPTSVDEPEDLLPALEELRGWAGNPSLRVLEEASLYALRRSTISDMLNGKNGPIPPLGRVLAFVRACGVSDVHAWTMTWRRLNSLHLESLSNKA